MAVRGSRSVISWMTVCVSIVIVLSRIVGVHLKSISPILPREREKATAKEVPELLRSTYKGVKNFTQLIVDEERKQLLAGGRDFIFRLNINNLAALEVSHWPASPEAVAICLEQGRSEEECRNYLTALHVKGNELLVCGTFATHASCRHYDRSNLKRYLNAPNEAYRFPDSLNFTSTSLWSSTGEVFVSGRFGLHGMMPALIRTGNLKSLQSPSGRFFSEQFFDPYFVATFEVGRYIYVFFREKAFERLNTEISSPQDVEVYSRVVRICKDDPGYSVQQPHWTTFMKARLSCFLSGNENFYFNEIESVDYNRRSDTFYASFTGTKNQMIASAVCEFNRKDIDVIIDGPSTGYTLRWEEGLSPPERFQCKWRGNGEEPNNKAELEFSNFHTMSYRAVTNNVPLYSVTKEQATLLQVDELPWIDPLSKRGEDVPAIRKPPFRVILLGTMNGTIKKIVHDFEQTSACVVEEFKPFRRGEKMTQMKLSRSRNALYVATNLGVLKIPLASCELEKTRERCLRTGDPYCGWDPDANQCVFYEKMVSNSEWHQATPCTETDENKIQSREYFERETEIVSKNPSFFGNDEGIISSIGEWLAIVFVVVFVGYLFGFLIVVLVYASCKKCKRSKMETMNNIPQSPVVNLNSVEATAASNWDSLDSFEEIEL